MIIKNYFSFLNNNLVEKIIVYYNLHYEFKIDNLMDKNFDFYKTKIT